MDRFPTDKMAALEQNWDVVVIGAGAAGLMAAESSASRGKRTLVVEKNKKLGVKILISGGTRCNLTHDASYREMADAFGPAKHFLLSAMGRLTPQMVVELVEREGVPTTVEESTGKVFPRSNRALDVRDALVRRAASAGACFVANTAVHAICKLGDHFICQTADVEYRTSAVIVTTGGMSFPGCGTTGDGFEWARQFGHSIVQPRPALSPLVSNEYWVRELSGIAVEDTIVAAIDARGQRMGLSRAATLFTHLGLSGPGPMNISRYVTLPGEVRCTFVEVDWAPKHTASDMLEYWRDYSGNRGAQLALNLPSFGLPGRLFEQLLSTAGIDSRTKLAEIARDDWDRLASTIKSCRISVSGTRGFEKAEVTAGGVVLDEVNNRTMESKLVPGLFFAGEILDVDGPIGGYNFQAAFSTGTLAGQNV